MLGWTCWGGVIGSHRYPLGFSVVTLFMLEPASSVCCSCLAFMSLQTHVFITDHHGIEHKTQNKWTDLAPDS